jgi:hypothetical protein
MVIVANSETHKVCICGLSFTQMLLIEHALLKSHIDIKAELASKESMEIVDIIDAFYEDISKAESY